VRLCFFN